VGPGPHALSAPPAANDAGLDPPVKVDFVSRGNALTGWLFPARRGSPAPVMVYNHGSERDPDLAWLGDVGRFYQSHGFAAFFPWRQGCAGSGGTYWSDRFAPSDDEADPALHEARNIRALEDELVDVKAAIDYARTLPGVDAARVYVGGASFGGLLALMAADSPGLKGAVVCSGAGWTFDGNTPSGLRRLEELALAAKAPVFFLQAANDFNAGSAPAIDDAMTRAGLAHQVKVYPAYGTTQLQGHAGFCNRGASSWGADVLAWLRSG
jgi:dienelactone hydrolase